MGKLCYVDELKKKLKKKKKKINKKIKKKDTPIIIDKLQDYKVFREFDVLLFKLTWVGSGPSS